MLSVVNGVVFELCARQQMPQRGLFSCSSLFLLSYYIVFFQFTLLAPFYEEIRFNSFLWVSEKHVNWTTMIAAVSLNLFFVGYLWRLSKIEPRKPVRILALNEVQLGKLLLIFPCLSIGSFLLFVALVGPAYLKGGYAGSGNWGGGASHAYRLFEVFYYLTIALEVYKIKLRSPNAGLFGYILGFNIVTGAFVLFYLCFNLFVGDRGPFLSTMLILVGGYDFFFKKINPLIATASVVVGVILLAFVSDYRSRDSSLSVDEKVERGKEKRVDKKYYEYTGDLASSVRIMNYAVDLTPEISDYYFGWIQAGRLSNTIPFSAGLFRKVIPFSVHNTPLGSTSSSVFTYYILGPNSTIGTGTSILGDLYLDFGIIGCLVGMFGFGYFIGWVELRAQSHQGVYQIVFYLLVVSTAIYWPRSFIGVNFQSWFLSILCIYASQRYLLNLRIRRVSASSKIRIGRLSMPRRIA